MSQTDPVIFHPGQNPWSFMMLATFPAGLLAWLSYLVLQPGCDCKTGAPLPISAAAWLFAGALFIAIAALYYGAGRAISGVAVQGEGEKLRVKVQNRPRGDLEFCVDVASVQKIGFAVFSDGEGGENSSAYMDLLGYGRLELTAWKRETVDRLSTYCKLPLAQTEDQYPKGTLGYIGLRDILRAAKVSGAGAKAPTAERAATVNT